MLDLWHKGNTSAVVEPQQEEAFLETNGIKSQIKKPADGEGKKSQ